jgi:hypothetical protein
MHVPLVNLSIQHAQLQPILYVLSAQIFHQMLHTLTLVRLYPPVNGYVILDIFSTAAFAPNAPSTSGVF